MQNTSNNQVLNEDRVHTLAVAAVRLGLSASYLRLLCWTGELPGAYKSGSVWLVNVDVARSYLLARRDGRRSA